MAKTIDFEQELYRYFGQIKDFTLGMRIARHFYEMGYHEAREETTLTEAHEDVKETLSIAFWKFVNNSVRRHNETIKKYIK